jgi:propionyl-CoA carboxylase alpha chain
MYYDPMISKLVAWGKDRRESIDLLATALDEYVVRGVTHNIGFGRSMLRNKDFLNGSYSTAFIPTYYPNGFKGDVLTNEDINELAVAIHQLKN